MGLCQAISIIFMLWAVFKLYCAIGRNFNLRELFSQKIIIIHITTFIVYLLSLVIMYIYYSKWDTTDLDSENKVFYSFAASIILLFFV